MPSRDGLTRAVRAPVALGGGRGHLGLGPASLARLVGYDDVQTVCAAALKLLPLDPVVATGWVARRPAGDRSRSPTRSPT